MRAYNELYLDDAMMNLGEAVEYAYLKCGIPMDDYMSLFIASGSAEATRIMSRADREQKWSWTSFRK